MRKRFLAWGIGGLMLTFTVVGLAGIFMVMRIPDGTQNLEGEAQAFARKALGDVDLLWEHPLQRVLVRKKQVRQVEGPFQGQEPCDEGFGTEGLYIEGHYRAIVRGYTFFGIAISEAEVTCNGAGLIWWKNWLNSGDGGERGVDA